MTDTNKLSAIDLALAAAKARKAAKDSAGITASETKAKAAETNIPRTRKSPSTDAEAADARKATREANKANKLAQLQAERSERRTAREAAKAEKVAMKMALEADKKPAHMKKVEKAAAKLPKLNERASILFSEIVGSLDAASISSIALHLQHHNRVAATQRARNVKVEQGDLVRIVGGDPRFIGLTGTVDRSQRIRCYVDIPGRKPIYLFTSDVELVKDLTPKQSSKNMVG